MEVPVDQRPKSEGDEKCSRARLLSEYVHRVWPLLLGNVLEWYEYAIYGYLVPQVTTNFFHGSSSAAWLAFAVNFVVRPLGGFVFGWVADRFGRRSATVMSMLGMMIATVGQGMLPSSYCCGPSAGKVGTALIVTLRALQGFCCGGESAGILPYIAETAPGRIKCTAASVFVITLCTSFSLASGFVFLLTLSMSEADMMLWGWRIPFLVCLIPGMVALCGRQNLPETPEFLEWQESQKLQSEHQKQEERQASIVARSSLHRMRSFCSEHAVGLIVVIFGSAAGGLAWNQALWTLSYARANGLLEGAALAIGSAMQVVTALTVVVTAVMSDMRGWGPYPALRLGTFCLVLAWVPLFGLLAAFPGNPCVAALCISLGFGVLLGLSGATYHIYFVSVFQIQVRGRLFGVAWNISLAVFSGFAGAISQGLLKLTPVGPPLYLCTVGTVSLATLLWAGRVQVSSQLKKSAQPAVATESNSESQTGHVSV